MALLENIDSILATSPALSRLTPERRAKFAARLEAAEREYRAWVNASQKIKERTKSDKITRSEMRRDLKRAEKLATQLEEAMNTPAIRHLTLTPKDDHPYDSSPVREQLRFARAFLEALNHDNPCQPSHGGSRHHGDLVLHDLADQLVRAYAAATGKKPTVSVSSYTGEGSAVLHYVAACFDLLGVRRRSNVAIRNLIRRVDRPKS